MVDANGTQHDYSLDGLGREISDAVTLPDGSPIDSSVLRIDTAYDVRGNVSLVTSFSNTDGASDHIVNQVSQEYNTFDELTDQYQSVSGAVTDDTPDVHYSYANGTSTPTRLVSITYPNGRVVTYVYNSGIDSDVGRVSYLVDGNSTTPLVEYKYLGLSTIDDVNYPEPDVDYSLGTQNEEGTLANVDQFGRPIDQVFTASSSTLDEIQYGYDISNNMLWSSQITAATDGVYLDELYGYNAQNELTSATQGELSSDHTAITAHTGLTEIWTLDGMGNWSNYTQTGGTAAIDQDEPTNALNEIESYDNSSDESTSTWAVPGYDAAGNMTTIPQPGDESNGMTGVYDAWNRLVIVKDGSTIIAGYSYDGLNRRMTETVGGTTTSYYFSAADQVLEERVGDSSSANLQYVWGLRYVNDLILRDANTGSGGNLGINDSGLSQRLYVLQDVNWNVVALVNTSGSVVERYTYTAYGTVTVRNADFSVKIGGTAYAWTMLFAGEDVDKVTGLSYNDNRWYVTSLGVFTSTDPAQSNPNEYLYALDNPNAGTDPSGLATTESAWDPMQPDDGSDQDPLAPAGGSEHTSDPRPSTKGKHQKGADRKQTDRGGEKADANRRLPRRRPEGWKGPWPPQPDAIIAVEPRPTTGFWILVGLWGVWEVGKQVVAIGGAPETGGASLLLEAVP
jgi:RHS repeat-associated protein